VTHRDDPQWRPFYARAFGKRPREELYDLRKDPQQMDNVAGDLAYAKIRRELEDRLMKELTSTGDPRVQENGKFYETPPMTGPLEQTSQAPRGKSKKP
jgi:hypothetical protein